MTVTLPSQSEGNSLHLPRLLCLHGGGTNARIFRAQCRVFRSELRNHFRFVFAEAPFPCQPGPDVVSVYKDWGPFRRWLRSGPEHPKVNPQRAVTAIDKSLEHTMREDDNQGATGEWVGLLGFSQGAKLASSLLFRQQKRQELLGTQQSGPNWRFAVIMAGRGPIVSLDHDLVMNSALVDASQVGLSTYPTERTLEKGEHILKLPTIHVHGLQDQGLELHRHLLNEYCDENARRVVWNGNHRVPIKSKDVSLVVQQILEVAEEQGVFDWWR